MNISNRAREIQASPIRKLAVVANETKKRGIKIYHLNIGQPDIPTPRPFMKGSNNLPVRFWRMAHLTVLKN